MTHQQHREEPAFDPDFDAEEAAPHTQAASQQMTISLSLTPKKIFLAGFVVGIVIMGIPTAYLYARQGGGSGIAQAGSGVPSVAPSPSAPTPSAPQVGTVKAVSNDDHIRGAKNAKVTMIEYSDLECPFCKRFHPTMQQIMKDYDGKIAWVYRHFPLSFHANAQKEAEASECVASIGGTEKYWKYIDTIFERTTANGTGFALDQLGPLAKEVGVDEAKFKECLDGGKMTARVNKDLQEGQAAGVDGTPGTILVSANGKKALVPGAVPVEELKSQIDALLK